MFTAENFCRRVPITTWSGPSCVTRDELGMVRLERCDVPYCSTLSCASLRHIKIRGLRLIRSPSNRRALYAVTIAAMYLNDDKFWFLTFKKWSIGAAFSLLLWVQVHLLSVDSISFVSLPFAHLFPAAKKPLITTRRLAVGRWERCFSSSSLREDLRLKLVLCIIAYEMSTQSDVNQP